MIPTSEFPCDVCGAPAVVVLSDAQREKPAIAKGKLFACVAPLGQRALCKKHLRPPRLFGPDGKLIQECPLAEVAK